MEKNQIIIIALIVVIVALLVGMAAMLMPNMSKQDTQLKFKSNSTLTEGDSLKIKLTDANGTAIANQTVNVTITDKNNASDNHSVVTNEKGVGTLKLDKNAGEYTVTVIYNGNDKYNACNATKKITVEEEVVETEPEIHQSTQSSGSSKNGRLHYDEEINVYYDDNGVIVDPDGQHFQGAGDSYSKYRDARDRWERGEPVMV